MVFLLLVAFIAFRATGADWTLWGGPGRDFQVRSSAPLADSWPDAGPPVLWKRPLGEGYSAITVRGDTVYTMYRRAAPFWQLFTPGQEVVVALDARTGQTRWQFAYDAPFDSDQGPGPHVMPQIVGDLVFTAGVTGKVHALKAATGERVWMHDVYTEFGGTRLGFGYSSHPLPYQDKLIVAAGGKGKAVVALDQRSGRVVWSGLSYQNSYNAPLLVNAAGRDQVVVLGAQIVLGVDPRDGTMLWWLPLRTDPGMAFCATPLWDATNRILVISGASGYGATALRLIADSGALRAETLWHDGKLVSVFGDLILAGETMYLSRGSGPAFLTAVDIRTGATKWSTREFAKATLLRADGKLIILDEEGWLALAQPNPDGSLTIRSKVRMLSPNAWTVPTLAGRTLYLRDRKVVMALDVGKR